MKTIQFPVSTNAPRRTPKRIPLCHLEDAEFSRLRFEIEFLGATLFGTSTLSDSLVMIVHHLYQQRHAALCVPAPRVA